MKFLIVNADDFGRYHGVSRGIINAHLNGIVSSTTAMVNSADAPASLDIVLEQAPKLGIGVHLNLTHGKPISPPYTIPTLVDQAGFLLSPLEQPEIYNKWHEDDLRRELTAQIERFFTLTGKQPTHLDSHYHASLLFPSSLKVTLELAIKYGIPIRRPPSTEPNKKASAILMNNFPNIPTDIAKNIISETQLIFKNYPTIQWPNYLELGFYRPEITLDNLLSILSHLKDGITELMCHPGYIDGMEGSVYRLERESEISILSDPLISDLIKHQNIKLITFSELSSFL